MKKPTASPSKASSPAKSTNGKAKTKFEIKKPEYTAVKPKPVSQLAESSAPKQKPKSSPGKKQKQSDDPWPPAFKEFLNKVLKIATEKVPDAKLRDEFENQYLVKALQNFIDGKDLWKEDWARKDPLEFVTVRLNKFNQERKGRLASAKRKVPETRDFSPTPSSPRSDKMDVDDEELLKRQKRAKRFADDHEAFHQEKRKASASSRRTQREYVDLHKDLIPEWDSNTLVGTCQTLEKPYLRLTEAPKPEQVRPLPVLKKAFARLKQKWKNEGNYTYICDQLKSLRQDMVVQRIRNEFAAHVYETHARIALEKGDLGEYNQCQTQLKQIYEKGIQGGPNSANEFTAYQILYMIYTKNSRDINQVLSTITPSQKSHKYIIHALQVRSAVASNNYHRLFKLYLTAPNMGSYLMDQFLERERFRGLKSICKAYRPHVPFSFVAQELGFEGISELKKFISEAIHSVQKSEAEHGNHYSAPEIVHPASYPSSPPPRKSKKSDKKKKVKGTDSEIVELMNTKDLYFWIDKKLGSYAKVGNL
ncbi:SAC3/GANP/Nin1/mts3/eIF-3 p25 family-domain-containing protein [Paraphysoderma sedebokerense]|nr:SAC3/GANP/Nin1/mts3/eIF-3 p25 family-domain-containing protein [Paraphysoderma sedebokerense]